MNSDTQQSHDDVCLAIDIGATKVAAGLLDRSGTITAEAAPIPSQGHDAEGLYNAIVGMARQLQRDAPTSPLVVGVGTAGPGRDHYRWVSPVNLPMWRNFPLAERLADDLQLQVAVENDGKAFTLAEGWLGAAKGSRNFMGMVVSTGVGGGIVLDGRLLDGRDGNAGHIGQVFVDPDAPPDGTGAPGLLEGTASGTAIERALGVSPRSAPARDRERCGVMVGRAAASVANLLDLQLVVVGGSVGLGFGTPFLDAAQRTVDTLSLVSHAKGTRVRFAGLGASGPLIGAGAVGWLADGFNPIEGKR